VRITPGFPLTFGRFGAPTAQEGPGAGPVVFGLPGNPVSAMVTFEQFVRPALRRLAGHRALFRPRITAVLGEPLAKPAGRLHLVRVQLARDHGRIIATSTGNQSSGVLRSMALAQGLLVFPAEASALRAGDAVQVQVLEEDFLAADDSGL
jgi:molybdopterin molybdotransferase